ncbi:unnamed protein product, partial [Amoebophrya sp. A25]
QLQTRLSPSCSSIQPITVRRSSSCAFLLRSKANAPTKRWTARNLKNDVDYSEA